LAWFETHDSVEAAIRREKQIKEWKREWKFNLIERDNPRWVAEYMRQLAAALKPPPPEPPKPVYAIGSMAFRPCNTTSWPWSIRSRAAMRPRPSDDPVMTRVEVATRSRRQPAPAELSPGTSPPSLGQEGRRLQVAMQDSVMHYSRGMFITQARTGTAAPLPWCASRAEDRQSR
jgi:hypothetical protein